MSRSVSLPASAGLLALLLLVGAGFIVARRRDSVAVLLGCMLLFMALAVVAVFSSLEP
jgi:hypothetical protein